MQGVVTEGAELDLGAWVRAGSPGVSLELSSSGGMGSSE